MKLEGTYTALVTPFHADGGVDFDALASLVEWQIESGIDGLVPCGSTGEAATLSHAEDRDVVRHVVDVTAGRVPVIAGTGSNSTREAALRTREAGEAGADAALLISPYYNKPMQDGIYLHYREVAEESQLPLVLYNIPGRTGSRVEPDTTARLSRVPGVIGLKEAGGDLGLTAQTISLSDPEFSVVSGDDALTLPMLAIGGRGVISTTSNVAPVEMAAITRSFLDRDAEGARRAHYELLRVMSALFSETNPIPVKTALAVLGRIPNPTLRLPLTEMQKANRDQLEAALAGLCRA